MGARARKTKLKRMRALRAEAASFNLTKESDALTLSIQKLTSDHAESGGRRRGKRMRLKPREHSFAVRFDVFSDTGAVIAWDADMETRDKLTPSTIAYPALPARERVERVPLPQGKGRKYAGRDKSRYPRIAIDYCAECGSAQGRHLNNCSKSN